MADSIGDPIFIFFVVFMVLLFMILLIKRLNKKPNPLDLEFPGFGGFARDRNQIPTISVAVHLHDHRTRSAGARQMQRSSRNAVDLSPPPPFESVVRQTSPATAKQPSTGDTDPPPPSYEEYLTLREKTKPEPEFNVTM